MATVINAEGTSLILNGTGITDFAEGDFLELNPVNPKTSHTNGARGSVNINKRIDSDVQILVVRVLRYSESDVFLNTQLNEEDPVVFNGSVKEAFTRDGENFTENWILENGSFTDEPPFVKNNQDGSEVVEYSIRFRSATRII